MNQEEIKQKIKGKQPYTLNVSESMTDRIVQNAKDQIARLQSSRDESLPDFQEKRQALEEAQRVFNEAKDFLDNIDEEIRQQNLVVDALVNFKSKDDPSKRLRLHSEPDGQNEEPRQRTRARGEARISWQTEASAVLTEAKRFMPAEELFDRIVQKPHIQAMLKNMKSAKAINTVKSLTVNNFISHAVKVAQNDWNARFKPTFTVYKDLLGLVEWVDEKNNVLDAYKEQFTHKRLERPKATPSGDVAFTS